MWREKREEGKKRRKSDGKGEKATVGTGEGKRRQRKGTGGEGRRREEKKEGGREKRGERRYLQPDQDYSFFSKSALFCPSSYQVLLERT